MTNIIIPNNLWKVPNALPHAVCEYIRNYYKEEDYRVCTFNKTVVKEYRDTHEVHMGTHPASKKSLPKMIWKLLRENIPQEYGGRKLVGPHYKTFYLLRYGPGQKFEQHRDGHSTDSKGNKSFLTCLVYLNSDCEGGQTRFFAEPEHGIEFAPGVVHNDGHTDIHPTEGTMALMRHYILHQACPVTSGVKYAIRFNILYENYGPWYTDDPTDKKFEGVGRYCGQELPAPYSGISDPIQTAWEQCRADCASGKRKYPTQYQFLSIGQQPMGRSPRPDEAFCNNCYEILDLKYDYYACPRCHAPVVMTMRNKD